MFFEEYLNKGIWLDVEEEITACSNLTGCIFSPFICLLWYDFFIAWVIGSYWEINIKSGTETSGAHLVFIQ